MKLKLERPIAFIDLETTGTNRDTDRIIEIGICKLFPDGSMETKKRRFNPGFPIPPASTEIHGITDEDVKDQPPFEKLAGPLLKFLDGCDIGGFNSNVFDVPFLFNEFSRAGIQWDYRKFRMIDVGNIFKIQEQRTLEAAVKFYCNKDHTDAHSAVADAEATANVFLAQMERYEDIPTDLDELQVYSNYGSPILDLSGKFKMENGVVVLNFGQHRGKPAKDHPDFLEWMIFKASFPADTVEIARGILEEYGWITKL